MPSITELRFYLDNLVARIESPVFIPPDPIAIPHGFDAPDDQEIIALFAALLAWGQRKTILNKMEDLCERMNFQPARFVRHFSLERDSLKLSSFRHRTFQPVDAIWLTHNLSLLLRKYQSIEKAFAANMPAGAPDTKNAIQGFSDFLLSIDPKTPARLKKHLARPATGSACKRLNMYLRWMVRPGPVDLGLWSSIKPSQLILPLDVHSGRTARKLGLLTRKQDDWKAALELTENCRRLCLDDPCKYDYAFFGAGAYQIEIEPAFEVSQASE